MRLTDDTVIDGSGSLSNPSSRSAGRDLSSMPVSSGTRASVKCAEHLEELQRKITAGMDELNWPEVDD